MMNTTQSAIFRVSELEEPIRAELFTIERLEEQAKRLATDQIVFTKSRKKPLFTARIQENGRVLLEAYQAIIKTIKEDRAITPAAEWLIDNFYIVDEQLREIEKNMPPGFYRKLPKLASGPLMDYPRVFEVAWAFVAHTDSRFDPEIFQSFLKAYQCVQPLTIGELWALSISLRMVLLENLRRLVIRILHSQAARWEADKFADGLLGLGGVSSISPETTLYHFKHQPMSMAFAVQLIERLRDLDPMVCTVSAGWLYKMLAAQGSTAEDIIYTEHQQQATMNTTVRNIITSMRVVSSFDWTKFFETVSQVDQILSYGTNFAEIDFSTRDHYRHVIEDLSQGSGLSEIVVAERLVERTLKAQVESHRTPQPHRERYQDPGYYLISEGRFEFERELGYRISWKLWLLRLYVSNAVPSYLGTIAVVTGIMLALPLLFIWHTQVAEHWLILLGVLAVIPASDLAIALINRTVMALLGPRTLPRLELKQGIPENLRSLVAVPTILTTLRAINEQVKRLEVHYLSNSEGDLHFALLTDWVDAPSETLAEDDELLAATVDGIARLNKHYGATTNGSLRFLLFHRRRVWNASEGTWMGWERKRGKLHELNQLLRGSPSTTFVTLAEHLSKAPSKVRYVITLDADTRLSRGTACRLVGTMAHPLNQPRFDAQAGRVVEGYAVVQPHIVPFLPTDRYGSLFQRAFSGLSGTDPYASAVSDVYQDLFKEGSYIGKGIYDVDAFEDALAGKVPTNVMLSHDLFEGIFARAALATDIELFEEFPTHYEVAAARQHRWARGDWQLLPWILGWTRIAGKDMRPVVISAISRWKMLDNLRRTLSAPAAFLTLLVGWLQPGISPWVWTSFILTTVAIPALLSFMIELPLKRNGTTGYSHLRAMLKSLALGASQIALTVTFLAYQTWLMSDAILRTLSRLLGTRTHLLQWMTAAQAKDAYGCKILEMYPRMAGGLVLAAAAGVVVGHGRPQSWVAVAPFLLLWAAAPAVAYWISLPPRLTGRGPASSTGRQALRLTARRTWRFFETFISPEDHALPPDNFQEDPTPVVAHRTSPTNMGLYLLSILAARDFGWLGSAQAVERLEATLTTMTRLELFHGHFYNWYDTRDLHPLAPKYVSSVDSGNLAGHLLALANGCREMQHMSIGAHLLTGVDDTVQLLRGALASIADTRRTYTVTRKQLSNAIDALAALLEVPPVDTVGWAARLVQLRIRAFTVADMAQALARERGDSPESELQTWADATKACVDSHGQDEELLIPWARLNSNKIPPIITCPSEQAPEWMVIAPFFHSVPTLMDVPERCEAALCELAALRLRWLSDASGTDRLLQLDALSHAIRHSATEATALIRRLSAIIQTVDGMFQAMDFKLLFNQTRKLFSIGYRSTEGDLDPNCYDLLASEARLTSFIAIAKGDVSSAHWLYLGRALTSVGLSSALISWSGSMFEYLMPTLVMRTPVGSLLYQTQELIVRRQIAYGAERRVPWGVSESAYNMRDLDLTYQYSSFGVPGLGLKQGLSKDVVVAPYATALAAMIDPAAATQNLARLAEVGGKGAYGFYEALDYTKVRMPNGQNVAVVRAYMAHHQGMSIIAIGNVLHGDIMSTRFHAEPMVQATELLLQERPPRDVFVTRPRTEEFSLLAKVPELTPPRLRRFTTPHDGIPQTHLLSNRRYTVMLTSAGSGYSRWGDIAVTRWREDATRDNWGTYTFLRDAETGQVWSAGYQPSGVEPDTYEALFCEDHAKITRCDGAVSTTLEVVVSSEDDAEVRRVSLTNLGSRARDIQVTSYVELCLTSQATDVAHPAFSNLFVQTEFVSHVGVLLATRRRQSEKDVAVWTAHMVMVNGETIGDLQFETDRAQFLGRGHHIRTPVSMIDGRALSNTVGSVLDPVMSLRRTVRIQPGTTAHLVFSIIVGSAREQVLDLADKYRDPRVFERTQSLAWTQAQVQLHHLGISHDEACLFQMLANAVLYANASLRPSSDVLSRTMLERSVLWSYGISGDLPIVLVRIDNVQHIGIIRQLLRAHEYWNTKQLSVDVIILNESPPSYLQELQVSLETLVRSTQLRVSLNMNRGGSKIVLLRAELVSTQNRLLLQSVARVVLLSRHGTLAEQLTRSQPTKRPVFSPLRLDPQRKRQDVPLVQPTLEFFNGLGGFAEQGREYVTILGEGLRTPQPWINVIANPSFGFLVSESGSGCTWSLNSHENQLTPWSNDPVTDSSGEAIYIRDDHTGEVWNPTALPIRDETAPYLAAHGQGYSRFQHGSHGILTELLQFVPTEDPVKISRLVLKNVSGCSRRLSVTAYAEWVLGSSRSASAPYIITEADAQTGALFAWSTWGGEFGGRIAFTDLAGRQTSWTGDRTEFLGRNGTPERPAALEQGSTLSGRVGAGLDPCTALQTTLVIPAGESAEIIWFLGQTDSRGEARALLTRYRSADLNGLFYDITSLWDNVLDAVQVITPDRAMDLLINRWLLYQTLACHVWGRAAFYQLSGAYGFRDQLQDVMALSVPIRAVAREHLLRAASRQFVEGDVQHWWHPPSGRGVRTRIADDLLWLPYVVTHFIETTGDQTVLDEVIPFLKGDILTAEQHESYFQPHVSETTATLFEHCARALDRSLAVGSHGLPLMGTGDWNDGMNRVGHQGKGESVWLGWFLHTTLWEFAKVAAARGEHHRAETWRTHVSALKIALEQEAWDGEWYRRAYFDDGTALGSAGNQECRIDSIAQSWAVLSGAAETGRGIRAMTAVEQYLVRRPEGLIVLFTPPFDHTPLDPGYIKGYVPGIRENGGQYSHAAVWTVLAFAALGEGDKARELFQMLNPITRTTSLADVLRYKTEPYVLAGEVYAEPPHVGRGGWTWYTGAAGWLHRAGMEGILGFRLRGATLWIDPCIPRNWPSYSIRFRYNSAVYNIAVYNPRGVSRGVTLAELDGKALATSANIPLIDDGAVHQIRIVLG